MDESKQTLASPGGAVRSVIHGPHMVQTGVVFAERLDVLGSRVAHLIKGRKRMNSLFSDELINASIEDIPAAIPSLIDAAVAAFDADRDTSRLYLMRASAFLRIKHAARTGAESFRRSESRGGLLAWQLNRVVEHIETHLGEKIVEMGLANLINMSVGQLIRAFKISVGVPPFHYIASRRVELACTMMSTTREPLAQIAVACGLCDQAHLCKLFRRVTGTSPSAWRRAMRAPASECGRLAQTRACRTTKPWTVSGRRSRTTTAIESCTS
jgi:AraC family transcriptional regulator